MERSIGSTWRPRSAAGFTLALGLLAGACEQSPTGPGNGPGSNLVARVAITPGTVQLLPGEEASLKAVAYAADNRELPGWAVTWHSYNTAVATVSGAGKVTAVAAGTAVIRGTIENVFTDVTVTVSALNPVPTLTSVTPDLVETTTPVAVITLRGARFAQGAVAVLNGTPRPALYISATELHLVLGPADLQAAGPRTIAIRNPAPGGGTSDPLPLTIAVGVSSVVVNPAQVTLSVGQSVTLQPRALDAAGSELGGRTFSFTSSNQGAVSVSQAGVVTALGVGPAIITVSTGGKSAAVQVNGQPAVQFVMVTPAPASVLVGSTTQLTARTLGASGAELTGRPIAWSSENPAIATVDATGRVTGVAKGTVRINAVSENVVGSVDLEVRQWGPGPVSTLTLRGFRETVVWPNVGATTWVDGQGNSHPATQTLFGGTLTLRFDSGRWTRTYIINLHVGTELVGTETWTETGSFGYSFGTNALWFTSDATGETVTGMDAAPGEVAIRQSVGNGPALTQRWILE